MRRVAVIGVTGSGKTTLARALSDRLDLPHVELDRLYWRPNWTKSAPDEFRGRLTEEVQCERWVVDGNYSLSRDIVWSAADTLVWLDYELPLIMWRLFRRTALRTLRRELLWGINRERFWPQLFESEGLFRWALQTHPRYRREFPTELRRPAYAHLTVVQLASPRATNAWLAKLPRS
ncbi:MAG TPA: adenylate kinase [Chloroflexota bacterium]|nr:adenylate kinase [Chloroflexota bacterium]